MLYWNSSLILDDVTERSGNGSGSSCEQDSDIELGWHRQVLLGGKEQPSAKEDLAFAILFLRYWLEVVEVLWAYFLCELIATATNFTLAQHGVCMFVSLGYVHGTARQPQSLLEQPVQRAFVCTGSCRGCKWGFGSVLSWWAVSDWCPSQAGGGLAGLCSCECCLVVIWRGDPVTCGSIVIQVGPYLPSEWS